LTKSKNCSNGKRGEEVALPLDVRQLHGTARKSAVKDAADQLLEKYRERWPSIVPVELHRLASSLQVRIEMVKGLTGGARLLPASGGFLILVSDELPPAKFRTSVAHELAHTLFYSRECLTPERAQEATKAEESFCFDVARFVLAPRWALDRVNTQETGDPEALFQVLHDGLRLSKPLAARVMLDDYELATGVAGRWEGSAGLWTLQRGSACATSALTSPERKALWEMARAWVCDRAQPAIHHHVFGFDDKTGRSSFVVVVKTRAEESAKPPKASLTEDNPGHTQSTSSKYEQLTQGNLF
jgi:hypothetical protein